MAPTTEEEKRQSMAWGTLILSVFIPSLFILVALAVKAVRWAIS